MSYAFRTCRELIGVLVQTIQKKKICRRIYVINGGDGVLKRFLWYFNHVSALIELLVEVVFVILSEECHRCNGGEHGALKTFLWLSNHVSALVEPLVEVGEVEGQEGNDVRERGSLWYDRYFFDKYWPHLILIHRWSVPLVLYGGKVGHVKSEWIITSWLEGSRFLTARAMSTSLGSDGRGWFLRIKAKYEKQKIQEM